MGNLNLVWGRSLCGLALALFVVTGLVRPAAAELNLWIAYNFAGLDAYGDGDYHQAEAVLIDALEEVEKPYRRAETLEMLGRVYTSQGRFEEAQEALSEALSLKKRSLGSDHRSVAITLNSLADLHYVAGHGEADIEGLYREALEINLRDMRNAEVCRALNGLALLHHDAGEVVEAEKLLERAIELHTRAERRDNPYLSTVLVNLGVLLTKQGRYEEAAPLLSRAQFIQETELRPGHPDVAVRLHAQAKLLSERGDQAEAVAAARAAEDIRAAQRNAGNAY